MRVLRGLAALVVVGLAAACASVPQPQATMSGELLSGRMSVQVDGAAASAPRAMNAAFELEGDAGIGRFGLVTPLGTVVAQARWRPGEVVLVTTQGETHFTDLDALTRQVLGEPLPVAALFDWLRGRPWPGAPSATAAPPAAPGFEQLGWSVNLARFDEAWVTARRAQAPAVTVRAKLDRP